VDGANDVGTGEDKQVVVATDVALVVAEAPAAEIGLGQAVALDQRARGAVEHENPPLQQRAEQEQALFARPDVGVRRCGPGFILGCASPGGGRGRDQWDVRLGWPASFWRQCTRH